MIVYLGPTQGLVCNSKEVECRHCMGPTAEFVRAQRMARCGNVAPRVEFRLSQPSTFHLKPDLVNHLPLHIPHTTFLHPVNYTYVPAPKEQSGLYSGQYPEVVLR